MLALGTGEREAAKINLQQLTKKPRVKELRAGRERKK